MSTSPIGTSTTPPASTSPTDAATGLTQNFNTFLTLLTTQLQNQDPLSPMDTNQFTQQLVAFSQVEQQINTNTNLQQLISLQSAGESISALPLVGQNIEYNSPTAPMNPSSTPAATYVYAMPSDAASTELTVTDANGQVVDAQPGNTQAGTYVFNWNGQTNTGVPLPAGNYTLNITARDASGNTITPTISSVGAVSAVGVNNGTASFTVNGMTIPLTELVMVDPNTNTGSSN
jgi:flagellar basal-body rod modification protein FlgD